MLTEQLRGMILNLRISIPYIEICNWLILCAWLYRLKYLKMCNRLEILKFIHDMKYESTGLIWSRNKNGIDCIMPFSLSPIRCPPVSLFIWIHFIRGMYNCTCTECRGFCTIQQPIRKNALFCPQQQWLLSRSRPTPGPLLVQPVVDTSNK